ncbi:uncharacterized protein [Anabrus simplex]|uniref:uncharacterized protein n=1 Tax=Anabrus simplex TaxID=316456 RepID=UPI0035A35DAA
MDSNPNFMLTISGCNFLLKFMYELLLLCEMDQKVEIKEEPVWLDGTAGASFDSYQLASEETHLQEEMKSELAEPGQTKMYTFEEEFEHESAVICLKEETKPVFTDPSSSQPAEYVEDEVKIESRVDEAVPCVKEENNFENLALLSRGPVDTFDNSCKIIKSVSKHMAILPPQNELKLHVFSHSVEGPRDPIETSLKIGPVEMAYWSLHYQVASGSEIQIVCDSGPNS